MKFKFPVRSPEKCLYIYTMPKAGTYLLASLCEELGMVNSGRHISFTSYLDTLAFPAKVNRHYPSKTRIQQQFIKTFKQSMGQTTFGHLSPSFLPPGIFYSTDIITAYRQPLEVLVSEYNDFRYIRKDVRFCSIETEENDVRAFELYLKRQAPVIRDIMIEMARYFDCFSQSLYAPKYARAVPIIINFNRLKDSNYIEWLEKVFTYFLPNGSIGLNDSLKSTYNKETKTKSHEYPFDIDTLWTDENLLLIKPLRLRQLHQYLMRQEMKIIAAIK